MPQAADLPDTAPADTLPALIDRAALALAGARSSAEVLEARDMAGLAYDLAKSTGRLLKAKQAHDELVSAAYRAQGDALLIESQAKRRLADEYDAAQARGEVGQQTGRPKVVPDENDFIPAATDLGLTRKDIHEARQFRDAEVAEPGVVRRAVEERILAGREPTKASVREAVRETVAPKSNWTPGDIIPNPRPAPYIQGDTEVHHAIQETWRVIGPLGAPRKAMRNYSPQLAHCCSVEQLVLLARWFAEAAAEWKLITTEGVHVAAE